MEQPIPIACSLDGAELPRRAEQIAALGRSLVGVRAEGAEATLRFPADRRDEVEEFIAAESRCCPFFDFDLTERDEELELAIAAPPDGAVATRGLVANFVAGWGPLA